MTTTKRMAGLEAGGHRQGGLLGTIALLLTLVLATGIGQALAAQVTLGWDPNTEPNLAGYFLYYGRASRNYSSKIPAGNVTAYAVTGLVDGQAYYFAVTAYDLNGNESGYSNEVFYAGGTPAAEINVLGNGVTIADGDATPLAADHTDFGSSDVAGGTVTRTFTVQNTGLAELSLTGSTRIAVGGANAADFTVIALPAASIAAAGSTTFQVRFDPSAPGTRTGTLSIASNDADENPYNFSIRGSGTSATANPEIGLLGNAVPIADGDATPSATDLTDFGNVAVTGSAVTRTYTVQNTGTAPLTLAGSPPVSVGGMSQDFRVTVQPSGTIAAGASATFTVSFDPSGGGVRAATLSIASNDADESPYDFAIQGVGVPPPTAPTGVRANQ